MKVLIFGETTEGRKLFQILDKNPNFEITLSVATEEMTSFFKKNRFHYVIDATHPFATDVTINIKTACEKTSTKYLRLRPESQKNSAVTYVKDANEAALILNESYENVLLTIGSKELESFTHVKNFSNRIYVRILPMMDSLKKAIDLGFNSSNIICMEGPFQREMNIAMIKMTKAKYLVTKESEDIKVSGCKVIAIARPVYEEGFSLKEILKFLRLNNLNCTNSSSSFFPLFINMWDKNVLVIGSGNVARRRIKSLSSSGANITVISPNAIECLKDIDSTKKIEIINRKYMANDIENLKPFLVISATNDRDTNHAVMVEAKPLGILTIISDCKEECNCYFPAICESDEYIAGLISKTGNHIGVREKAKELRRFFKDE